MNYQTPFQKRSTASEFRATARGAMKGRLGLVIGVFLLACILGLSSGSASVSIPSGSSESLSEEYLTAMATKLDLLAEEGVGAIVEYLLYDVIGIVMLAILGFSILISVGYSLFVGAPTTVGYHRFNLELVDRKPDLTYNVLFCAFKTCYWKSVVLQLALGLIGMALAMVFFIALVVSVLLVLFSPVLGVFVFFAVTVLAVVVSINVTYRFALSHFILAEYPELSVMDVLKNSAALMNGNKFRLFCLELSFIGWELLAACCTCGLGMLLVTPYVYAAKAAFYYEVTGHDVAKEVEFPSLNPDDYFPSV